MKVRVSDQGLIIPKEFFVGVEEVEIQQHDQTIVVTPVVVNDTILQLGIQPIEDDITDASVHHDRYI